MKTNYIKWFLFLICFIFGIISCQPSKNPINIHENGVEVIFPPFVSKEKLADDAFLQYANRFRNFYIVGFKFPKNNPNQDSLWSITTHRITKNMDSITMDTFHYMHHNLPSIRTEIKGYFPNEKDPIYYYSLLLFGFQNNYQLTIWTRGVERRIKYKETIDDIFASFNELKQ